MQKIKILLVDSREDFFEGFIPYLKQKNFEVFTANSLNEALHKFDEVDPDFVITALILEHYDSGFVLSYKLKQKKPNVIIYILTSVTYTTGIKFSVNTEEERKWIKADGLLNEPIKPEDLMEIIENRIERMELVKN